MTNTRGMKCNKIARNWIILFNNGEREVTIKATFMKRDIYNLELIFLGIFLSL